MAKRCLGKLTPCASGGFQEVLLEGLGEGVFVTNLAGKVVDAGASAQIITGRSAHETIGATLGAALGALEGEPILALDLLTLEGWVQTVNRARRSDGAPLTLRIRSRGYCDEAGRPKGAVHLFSETSLQENLHRRLVAHQRLAGLGELSAALVHEVGNPVSVILGFAHLLVSQDGEDPDGEIRSRIYTEARRCREIVDKVLDYARSSSRAPSPSPLSLREVAADVVALLGYRMRRSGIEARVEWEEECPFVTSDAGEMKQVLLNLMINAIDASPPDTSIVISGGGFVREVAVGGGSLTAPRPMVREERMVRVVVADRGTGLGSGDPDRYFAPFHSTKEKGGGLGLAVCRRIVEQLGGRLYLEEREGGGANAVMELPGSPQ